MPRSRTITGYTDPETVPGQPRTTFVNFKVDAISALVVFPFAKYDENGSNPVTHYCVFGAAQGSKLRGWVEASGLVLAEFETDAEADSYVETDPDGIL